MTPPEMQESRKMEPFLSYFPLWLFFRKAVKKRFRSVRLEMRDKNRMSGSVSSVAAGRWLDSLNCSTAVKSSQQFAAR